MAEKIKPEIRSRMMSSIRGRDTGPELAVRRILHAIGFRFRLYRKDLPGRPDIVLPRHRLAILVHGCFWHRHLNCHYAALPKTNVLFWTKKFAGNVHRDKSNLDKLNKSGWRTLVVWECAIRSDPQLKFIPNALRRAVISGKMKTQIPRVTSRYQHKSKKHSRH